MRALFSFILLPILSCAAWSTNPDIMSPPPEEEAVVPLSKWDVLEVDVFREKELGGVFRVGIDGMVELPMIGKVTVEGLLPEQIADAIELRLADGYVKNPQVFCNVKKYNAHKFYVLGQVRRPGTFPYNPGMDLLQALSKAGGLTPLAAGNSVTITRVINGADQRIVVPAADIGKGVAPNVEVRAGDIIYIPESLF
ncbi:MAG: polysaccharide biosynthesis/export family protein [Deltaproteobacteria bacterium]|nr:polysaccharide biosynthesis/export family protein [Deltaproteobacteria bacterium]